MTGRHWSLHSLCNLKSLFPLQEFSFQLALRSHHQLLPLQHAVMLRLEPNFGGLVTRLKLHEIHHLLDLLRSRAFVHFARLHASRVLGMRPRRQRKKSEHRAHPSRPRAEHRTNLVKLQCCDDTMCQRACSRIVETAETLNAVRVLSLCASSEVADDSAQTPCYECRTVRLTRRGDCIPSGAHTRVQAGWQAGNARRGHRLGMGTESPLISLQK